jgi:hypothetical protein
MADNVQRAGGRPSQYKFDRGGAPTEMGPFIGIVVNNVDTTRSGRLQVFIEEFGDTKKSGKPNLEDKSTWRTVSYCPPFYGTTPVQSGGTNSSVGQYPGNNNSYGMWFTPPDLGVKVLCFFVAGDPTRGYYIGCVPNQQVNHMIPAIGAVTPEKREAQNTDQKTYFTNAKLLPVTEININNEQIADSTKFYDQKKPVHSYVSTVLFQQGLINDPVRGPIASSSQRESPSQCYGISTPGRPIYAGGSTELNKDQNFKKDVQDAKPADVNIIGRRGGHTFVMDDGDTEGKNNLIRIRTAQGHQITMSDDNNCFYIIHGNGQTWIELGQEGTVDVYATNSVNVRTQGTLNFHADKDINMFAGGKLSIKSMQGTTVQSETELNLACKARLSLYSQAAIGINANGTLGIKAKTMGINGGSQLNLKASKINLNGAATPNVPVPAGLTEYILTDTEYNSSNGWQVKPDGLKSIVTRAPTHEPYPYHNQGVQASVNMEKGKPSTPPGAPSMPNNWSITKK